MTVSYLGALKTSEEDLLFLRSQLEGLESIFFELMPFRIPLRRQEIQDFYEDRADWASQPDSPVAGNELRRQFNVKANQVRNVVDSAESLGNPLDRLNLVFAASSLPGERQSALLSDVRDFADALLNQGRIDLPLLAKVKAAQALRPVEARLLLAAAMFLITEEFQDQEGAMPVCDVLKQLIDLIEDENWLRSDDPFLSEARCVLMAVEAE